MSAYTRRAYAGVHDLVDMCDLVSATHDHTWWRTGDLGWAVRKAAHHELSLWITLWHDDDARLAGFVWNTSTGFADLFARRDAQSKVFDEMVQVWEDGVAAAVAAGDRIERLRCIAGEGDDALRTVLQQRGFAADDRVMQVNRRRLDSIDEPLLPSGYTLAQVDDGLVEARVEAHRAAFAPSALTVQMYQRLRASPLYRAELDRVVLSPQGHVVACCTAWLDPANASGLLEPVGTHPDFQRRGLATAVCLDALHALRAAGARQAQVGCDLGSAGCATYIKAGFSPAGTAQQYVRPLGARPDMA